MLPGVPAIARSSPTANLEGIGLPAWNEEDMAAAEHRAQKDPVILDEFCSQGTKRPIVRFQRKPPDATIHLLEVLGAGWEVHPDGVRRTGSDTTGRTRSQMSEEERRRCREAYYARPDKQRYAPKRKAG
jgi:hypothetical protein